MRRESEEGECEEGECEEGECANLCLPNQLDITATTPGQPVD